LSETKDLSLLSSRELASMAQNQPDNTTLILNWMHRSLRDPFGVKPECFAAFTRLLPKIIEQEPPAPVGFVLGQLAMKPGVIAPSHLLNTAFKVERQGEFSLALRLLDAVLRDPQTSERDMESALFRAAILCETAMNNPQRALITYQEVVRRFPMSPFAEQAKSRGQALAARMPRT
ncbi:MAG TPA: hypothetical protein VEX38_03370, partial [Fimbriimonadaceae bacterium]|nr:hypothetical protein [Fimbriimonadaceae bacterium]